MRIVSLLPAATEITAALGLLPYVVGVSHECDFPDEANQRPRVTRCLVHDAKPASREIDDWVRRALHDNGTIYSIDEALLRKLQPDVILTQKLCDVCDFPDEANQRPRVTRCPVHDAKLASREIDDWVRRALHDNGTIYSIDEALLRKLQPDVILTQKLCDVCAVGYGTVAKLAQSLRGSPKVVNLEPTSLTDIFADIRNVADACQVRERAEQLIRNLSERVENIRKLAATIADRPCCFLMEWVDPPFCSGHWGP